MNAALILNGIAQKITNEEVGPFVRSIVAEFDSVYESCLTETQWNFAIAFQELSQIDETPKDKNYQYSFEWPANVMVVWGLQNKNSGSRLYEDDYTIINLDDNEQKFLTNETNVTLRYTKYVDVGVIPRWFADYVEAALAKKCIYLALASNYRDNINDVYERTQKKAYMIDATQQPLGKVETFSEIEAARHSGDYWDYY